MKSDIEKGLLLPGNQVASITSFSKTIGVARETIEKAYNILKEEGYLTSVAGKGNFVCIVPDKKIKVLMILNKMSSYKKEVYEAFIDKLGDRAVVDLQIHHYDPKRFRDIVFENRGKYHHFVVMPHFYLHTDPGEYIDLLKTFSSKELIILDKEISLGEGFANVYQDFKLDIFDSFMANKAFFDKYNHITMIFPKDSHHPEEIKQGVLRFCEIQKKSFTIIPGSQKAAIEAHKLFITLTETDLAALIKSIRETSLVLGEDIGIVSFNETVLKELLGVSVVTTDFAAMGTRAAEMILSNDFIKTRNPFHMIRRQSL